MGHVVIHMLEEAGHIRPTFELARALAARGHRVTYLEPPDLRPLVTEQGFAHAPLFEEAYPAGSLARFESASRLERLRMRRASQHAIMRALQDGSVARALERAAPDLLLVDLLENAVALVGRALGIPTVVLSTVFPPERGGSVPPSRAGCRRAAPPSVGSEWSSRGSGWPSRGPSVRARWAPWSEPGSPSIRAPTGRGSSKRSPAPPATRAGAWYATRRCPCRSSRTSPSGCSRRRCSTSRARGLRTGSTSSPSTTSASRTPAASSSASTRAATSSTARSARRRSATGVARRCSGPWWPRSPDIRAGSSCWWPIGAPESASASSPPNVVVLSRAPQLALLARARVAVHHGGLGSVKEALFHGVPQLVAPQGYDQPGNAARVAFHGAGAVLTPRDVEARSIRAHLEELDGSLALRERVRRLSARFREAERRRPGLREAVRVLEGGA
ncbi:MAG: glycosyltransferase [Sandaracinaceae bacterium]|nr:glycosyltransferase [Sandaracinaceae bacterium]